MHARAPKEYATFLDGQSDPTCILEHEKHLHFTIWSLLLLVTDLLNQYKWQRSQMLTKPPLKCVELRRDTCYD